LIFEREWAYELEGLAYAVDALNYFILIISHAFKIGSSVKLMKSLELIGKQLKRGSAEKGYIVDRCEVFDNFII